VPKVSVSHDLDEILFQYRAVLNIGLNKLFVKGIFCSIIFGIEL